MKTLLYDRLKKSLLVEVASGAHEEDARFLSRRRIEQMWHVSRPTAEKALTLLVHENILRRRDRRVFELRTGGVSRARLLLRDLPLPHIQGPDNWQVQRNRILNRHRLENHRFAVVISENLPRRATMVELVRDLHPKNAKPFPYHLLHLSAFLRETNRRFCDTVFFTDDGTEEALMEIVRKITSGNFAGVAVFQRVKFHPRKPLLSALRSRGIPVITAFEDCEGKADTSVDFNNELAGYEAMGLVLEKGHRDLVFLAGPRDRRHFQSRWKGALTCLHELNLEKQVRLRCHRPLDDSHLVSSTRQFLETLFHGSAPWPTAILTAGVHWLTRHDRYLSVTGVRIPRDVSVLGMGPATTISEVYGPFDIMEANKEHLGRTTAEQLIRMVSGQPVPRTCQIEMPYVKRGTLTTPSRHRKQSARKKATG